MTRTDKVAYAFAVLLTCCAAYMHFVVGNAGDKNWLLLAARMWLSGKKLYVDVLEVNPPLIVWVDAVPVWLSSHIRFLRDYNILVILGLGLFAMCASVSLSVMRYHPQFTGNRSKLRQFALLLCMVFITFTDALYFLDREYLILICTLPYVLRYLPSVARAKLPLPLRIVIGCLAGIGFCFKPHCILVFGGLQLLYMLRERSLRILISVENILIYSIGIGYLLAVWFFAREYFTVLLPIAMATYSGYNRLYSAFYFFSISLVTFAVPMVDFRWRYSSPYRKDILYLLAVCGFWLGYALLNNGWGYTYNPLTSMLRFTTGFLLWEYLFLKRDFDARGLPSKPFLFGARACMISFAATIGVFIATFFIFATYNCNGNSSCDDPKPFIVAVEDAHAHSFGTMMMNFSVLAQVYRATGAMPAVRFHNLWMIPKFFISDADFTRTHQWILEYVATGYAQDLNRNKPAVMFVDVSPDFFNTGKHVDLPALFSAYPAFKQAWAHYRFSRNIDQCKPDVADKSTCRFGVYLRTP